MADSGKNERLIELSGHRASRFWKLDFDELSEPERVFRSVWELEADVNNGGFLQYYTNPSGDTAHAVVAALVTIGAHEMAAIVREANTLFEETAPPRERLTRQKVVDSWSDEQKEWLSGLDDRFYEYPDDLTELVYDYVQRYRDEIPGASESGI